jgi:Tol biopolymer transport system component
MPTKLCSLCLSAGLVLWATAAAEAGLELVTKRDPSFPPSDAAGSASGNVSISADGRQVAFGSPAHNLIAGLEDANQILLDLFVRDLVGGTTTLVSRSASSPTRTGNASSYQPLVSGDGRYVAFLSNATDLVPGQTDGNSGADVFLYDRVAGTTVLVSRSSAAADQTGNFASSLSAISADGGFVLFTSNGTDLVTGQSDINGVPDTFLYDRVAGTVALVSHVPGSPATAGNGWSPEFFGPFPVLSSDGRFVAFGSTATDLVNGISEDNNGKDAFLYDRTTGTVALVSRSATTPGNTANGESWPDSISPDGSRIALVSYADNLVGGVSDANFTADVFVYQRSTGSISLVSRSSASATTTGAGSSFSARLSGDGGRIAFLSTAMDMIPGGSETFDNQVFLYDLGTGAMSLVSRSNASATTGGNNYCSLLVLSADGSRLAFRSKATNLVAGQVDVPDSEDVFLYGAGSGSLTLVSRADGSPLTAAGDFFATATALSADGDELAFSSDSDALATDGVDTDKGPDAFVYLASTDSFATVSVRHPDLPSITSPRNSQPMHLSADGRFLAFVSDVDQLVPGQVDVDDESVVTQFGFVFLHDRLLGTNTLVSHKAGLPATPANSMANGAALSAAGRFVLFQSGASDLVPGVTDTNNAWDIFLWERATGATTLVSHAAGSPATPANGSSFAGSLSVDARYLALSSSATDLVPGFTGGGPFDFNAYLVDRIAGTTTLISGVEGSPTTGAGINSSLLISGEGRHVAFDSNAANVIAGQEDSETPTSDVFVYDRVTGATQLVSRSAGSATRTAQGSSSLFDISADGRYIAFWSSATDLVAGFTPGPLPMNAYVYDRVTGITQLVSRTSASATTGAGGIWPKISADGRFVSFQSSGTGLVPGQVGPAGFVAHAYLFDRISGDMTLVSHAAGAPATTADASASAPRISADGRFVSFSSSASNLVPGQTGPAGVSNSFLYDRLIGTTRLVSGAGGPATQGGNLGAGTPLLSADGGVAAFASSSWDLVEGDFLGDVDLFLVTSPAPGRDLFTVTPCRVLDTRSGPALASGVPRQVAFSSCGVPATAKAVAVNVTVVQPTGNGNLTLYPGDLEPTGTSTINFPAGVTRANNAVLGLALDGTGTVAVLPFVTGAGTVHVLVDVSGYFE